ncbi:MAG: molecular chaperone DnaJ [Pseudomonadota bacterium]|nr:molecular chaperone DnaJ [Pseudomonadota bacterium]
MTDPYRLLGVPDRAYEKTAEDDADFDEIIRQAYLAAIRECPPERDRQRFERIRAAFEAIASARARLSHALFDTTPPTPEDLLAALQTEFQPQRPSEQRLCRVLGSTLGSASGSKT